MPKKKSERIKRRKRKTNENYLNKLSINNACKTIIKPHYNDVIKNKDTQSGVSIHFVNSEFDSGEIILQKKLQLDKNETVESLEMKVKQLEKQAIVEAFKICLK